MLEVGGYLFLALLELLVHIMAYYTEKYPRFGLVFFSLLSLPFIGLIGCAIYLAFDAWLSPTQFFAGFSILVIVAGYFLRKKYDAVKIEKEKVQ